MKALATAMHLLVSRGDLTTLGRQDCRGWNRVRGFRQQTRRGTRSGGRHADHDVAPTASGEHAATTSALRAMFTRDIVYLAVSALQVVLAALMTPILTRLVGVAEFGQLALAIVVAQLLGMTFS